MAINIVTETPDVLLNDIRQAVANITTWVLTERGDFTHPPGEGKNKAWLRPKIVNNKLVFNILRSKNGKVSKGVYAKYHCQFAEFLLIRFDSSIQLIEITPLATTGDIV